MEKSLSFLSSVGTLPDRWDIPRLVPIIRQFPVVIFNSTNYQEAFLFPVEKPEF